MILYASYSLSQATACDCHRFGFLDFFGDFLCLSSRAAVANLRFGWPGLALDPWFEVARLLGVRLDLVTLPAVTLGSSCRGVRGRRLYRLVVWGISFGESFTGLCSLLDAFL